MWVGIVSLFPDLIHGISEVGVVGRALRGSGVTMSVFNPREYTSDRHHNVDDRPYGGGPGMVMMVEPLLAAVAAAQQQAQRHTGARARVVLLTPQGGRLNQRGVARLSALPGLILVSARYEGVDQRFVDLAVDEELSIGDYVLSGGELPALVLLDAMVRLLPGTLGNAASAREESHLDGLLDYPQYTRPERVHGVGVPAPLLSGDHQAVARWRRQRALRATWDKRPDMLAARPLDDGDWRLLEETFAADEEKEVGNEQDH